MSDFLSNFNVDDYKDDYKPIPAGKYPAVISSTEMKQSQKGGEFLKLEIVIIDGQFKNRKVFTNLNLKNSNPDAEKIAKISLANICRAIGLLHPKSFSELCNKPMMVKLSVRPETNEFPASNDVKAWESINQTQPNLPPTNTNNTPEPQAEAPKINKKPWEK